MFAIKELYENGSYYVHHAHAYGVHSKDGVPLVEFWQEDSGKSLQHVKVEPGVTVYVINAEGKTIDVIRPAAGVD